MLQDHQPSETSIFFRLPPELRLEVYQLLLVLKSAFSWSSRKSAAKLSVRDASVSKSTARPDCASPNGSNLLLTCTKIYNECATVSPLSSLLRLLSPCHETNKITPDLLLERHLQIPKSHSHLTPHLQKSLIPSPRPKTRNRQSYNTIIRIPGQRLRRAHQSTSRPPQQRMCLPSQLPRPYP